jgi:hypothetical protein
MYRDERSRHRRLGTILVLALIIGVEEAFAGDAAGSTEVAGASPLPSVVLRAVRDAAAKLETSACQEVFSDFRDAAGNTLQKRLDTLEVSGAGYLRWAYFVDGQGKSICEAPSILAATNPGSRVVFVCTTQFSILAHREPGLAAALIIHEELHSLGLGERPPDSKAITAQVIARCGK